MACNAFSGQYTAGRQPGMLRASPPPSEKNCRRRIVLRMKERHDHRTRKGCVNMDQEMNTIKSTLNDKEPEMVSDIGLDPEALERVPEAD